jgi:hypothetical protein
VFRAYRQGIVDDVRKDVREAEQRRAKWADTGPPGEDDLDPRLRALIARAVAPCARLVPPVALGFFEESAAFMLDVHPRLTAWVRAFLGTRGLDDIETPARPPSPYDDFVHSLPPDHQAVAQIYVTDGTPERMAKRIGRIEGRGGVLSRGGAVDSALLHYAQQTTMRVLFQWPPRPPADPFARALEMERIVRRIVTSHFASITHQLRTFEQAGYGEALEGYVWAALASEGFEGEAEDRGVLDRIYRPREHDVDTEDAQRLPATLDRFAEAVASAAERFDLPEGLVGTWGPGARPWMTAKLAQEKLRLAEQRAQRRLRIEEESRKTR